MAGDVLIDLGPKWGHVVPLGHLESITHIQYDSDGFVEVVCEFDKEERRKAFRFKSRTKLSEDDAEHEKHRLLAFSSGLIPVSEVKQIVKNMEIQTGVKADVILEELVYDISFVRKLWASHMGEPFFRFVLQYDAETDNVGIEEDHNDEFEMIPAQWSDPDWIKSLDPQDRMLAFVYEVISKMVEHVLPEPEVGAFMDPDVDIPVMGQGIRTSKVDISEMGPQNTRFETG